MKVMTTTIRRGTSGKGNRGSFLGRPDRLDPEVSFDANGDFDMASFMIEPPATPEPFAAFQPVIYTDIDGNDVAATVISEYPDYPGWLVLDKREAGTIGDTEGVKFNVEARYVRPDDTVSMDAIRRQTAAYEAVTEFLDEVAKRGEEGNEGLNRYTAALEARDRIQGTRARNDFDRAQNAAHRELMRLADSDILSRDVLALFEFEDQDTVAAFRDAYAVIGYEGATAMQSVVYAKALEQYRGWVDEDVLEDVAFIYDEAEELEAMRLSSLGSHGGVDDKVSKLSLDECIEEFGGHVKRQSKTRAAAYEKARANIDKAFEALYDAGLFNMDQQDWYDIRKFEVGRGEHGDSPAAGLVRAAGQAAILRHFQKLAKVSDKQLDIVEGEFEAAYTAWEKKQTAKAAAA